MCDGAMTSMLPVVTLHIFGIKRGGQVYSYMYSVFGVAAIVGTILVLTCQKMIGYHGMLVICLIMTLIAATTTYFYRFVLINYTKLAEQIGHKLELKETGHTASEIMATPGYSLKAK